MSDNSSDTAAPGAQAQPARAPSVYLLSATAGWPTLADMRNAVFTPLKLADRNWRDELAPMFAVFMFALTLYGITAPREVTLEDDGLFLMSLHHFGVNHPPGYPLYSLLGGPFYHLMPDFLSPALKGHMFSGFAGAVACVAIYAIVASLVRSRMCALIAGIAYAASEAFWSQAIIAEVYTLNAAMFFIVLALCIRYAAHTRHGNDYNHRVLYAAIALTYGLGLSNHWPLMGLGSIALLFVVISQWRNLLSRLPLGAVFLALGLLPYIWIIIRSQSSTAVNFYGPIETTRDLWFYVTRQGYVGVDNQEGVGLAEKLAFAGFYTEQLFRQITPAGVVVAAIGFGAMLRSVMHRWLAVALLVGWFMTGPLMVVLIDFQTEFIWFSAFRVYHLLSYGIMVIYFGYGLAWIAERSRRWLSDVRSVAVASTVGGLVVAVSLLVHWRQNDRSDYTWARDLALFKLASVEPYTKLFTFDDLDLPVGYLNLVENIRPDVQVFNDQALVFGSRLYTPFLSDDNKSRVIRQYLKETEPLPIYYHSHRRDLFSSKQSGSDFMGFWRRVNREGADDRVILSDNLRLWLENNMDADEIEDRWTKQQAIGIVATLISAIYQATQNGYQLDDKWERLIDEAYAKNTLVHLFLLWNNIAAQQIDEQQAAEELAWINALFERPEELTLDNSNWADALLLKSLLYRSHPQLVEGDLAQEYEAALLAGLEYDFKYSLFASLADYYRGVDRGQDAIDLLADRYENISAAPIEFRQYHSLLVQEQNEGVLLRAVTTLEEESS